MRQEDELQGSWTLRIRTDQPNLSRSDPSGSHGHDPPLPGLPRLPPNWGCPTLRDADLARPAHPRSVGRLATLAHELIYPRAVVFPRAAPLAIARPAVSGAAVGRRPAALSPFDFVALISVRAVAQMAREQSLPLRPPAHADSVGHGGRRQQKQERLHGWKSSNWHDPLPQRRFARNSFLRGARAP